MRHSSATSDPTQKGLIPVWTGSIGSWKFSIGRRPFAAHELEGHYDKASDNWHSTISKLGFAAAYADLVDQALPEVAKIDHGGPLKVLDAGIGTGAFATAFVSRCPRDVDLTGVDISSEMLRQAEIHLQDCSLTAHLHKGDINNLPFADDTFDVILVAHVIEHIADPKQALGELYRVLRPGGVVVACITQRSSAGAYIQLKWRTHCVDEHTAIPWFQRCGFGKVRTVPLASDVPAQRFSNGYVGSKPKRGHQ